MIFRGGVIAARERCPGFGLWFHPCSAQGLRQAEEFS